MAPSDQLEEVSEHGGSGSGSLGKVKEDSRGEDRRGARRRGTTIDTPPPQPPTSAFPCVSLIQANGKWKHSSQTRNNFIGCQEGV